MKRVNDKFADILMAATPEEIVGIAKLLGVKVLSEEVDRETKKAIPLDGAEILLDILAKYEALGRRERRAFVYLLEYGQKKKKKGGPQDGTTA